MTDIQPVPGVTYTLDGGGLSRFNYMSNWTYCPLWDGDDFPWLDGNGMRAALPAGAKIHEVQYNPHTPETFRNSNFCPGCAKPMPDLPTDQQTSEEVQF